MSLQPAILTHPFFHGLTPEDIRLAAQWLVMQEMPRGCILFHVGDVADSVYLLFSGIVTKAYINPGGDEKIISVNVDGDIFGELFLGSYPLRVGTARVVADASIGRITRPNLNRLIERFPAIAHNLIAHLADEQRHTLARLHALMHLDARHRLLGTLLSLARRSCCPDEGWLDLPSGLTQEDIANIACLNRSTVNVQINTLREQGILGGKGRQLTLNRPAVEQLLLASGMEILE